MNTHIFDSWHLPHPSHPLVGPRDQEDLKAIGKFTAGVFLVSLLTAYVMYVAMGGGDLPHVPFFG